MELELPETNNDYNQVDHYFWSAFNKPLNGTDSRRRLEDKIKEQQLRKSLQEYNFDF